MPSFLIVPSRWRFSNEKSAADCPLPLNITSTWSNWSTSVQLVLERVHFRMASDGVMGQLMPQHKYTTWATSHVTTALTTRATPSDKTFDTTWHRREIELTSCGDQVPVWNEEFIPIMLLEDVGEDLQGKTLLLTGLLAPLVGVHFGVGQVGVIVLVVCKETGTKMGERLLLLQRCHWSVSRALTALSFALLPSLSRRCRQKK